MATIDLEQVVFIFDAHPHGNPGKKYLVVETCGGDLLALDDVKDIRRIRDWYADQDEIVMASRREEARETHGKFSTE